MNALVVSYYDKGSPYEKEADRLAKSLSALKVDHIIEVSDPFASWSAAVCYKPTFLRQCLASFREADGFLFVDADAEFRQVPDWRIVADCHFAFCPFKRSPYHAEEMLTGTLWVANTPIVRTFLSEWIEATPKHAHQDTPEQNSLKAIWPRWSKREDFVWRELPKTWCWIFDDFPALFGHDIKPVIVQHQASRRYRHLLKKP